MASGDTRRSSRSRSANRARQHQVAVEADHIRSHGYGEWKRPACACGQHTSSDAEHWVDFGPRRATAFEVWAHAGIKLDWWSLDQQTYTCRARLCYHCMSQMYKTTRAAIRTWKAARTPDTNPAAGINPQSAWINYNTDDTLAEDIKITLIHSLSQQLCGKLGQLEHKWNDRQNEMQLSSALASTYIT
jgi:hypothetical protein